MLLVLTSKDSKANKKDVCRFEIHHTAPSLLPTMNYFLNFLTYKNLSYPSTRKQRDKEFFKGYPNEYICVCP